MMTEVLSLSDRTFPDHMKLLALFDYIKINAGSLFKKKNINFSI